MNSAFWNYSNFTVVAKWIIRSDELHVCDPVLQWWQIAASEGNNLIIEKVPIALSFWLTAINPSVFWVEFTNSVTLPIWRNELLHGSQDQSKSLTGLQYAATAK